MPRHRIPGVWVNVVRKTLKDGTIKEYWYDKKTGMRYVDDPRTLENFTPRSDEEKAKPGSINALVIAYKTAPEYRQRAKRTKEDYNRYLDGIRMIWGDEQASAIKRKHVFALRDQFQETPSVANAYVRVLRLLMQFAVDRGWRNENPATRPKLLDTGEGYRPWEEDEIELFRAAWPDPCRERVLFELMINTGQRTVDVVAMQRSHIKVFDGGREIAVRQRKTGARVWVPLSNELSAVLDPWLKTHSSMMLVPSERTGLKLTESGLRQIMERAYDDAGLPDECVNHGLRYTAAARLSELGCDWETIASITGHQTVSMVRKYLAKRRAARVAVRKLNEL